MIDNTRVLSKQLVYSLFVFCLLFAIITVSLLTFTDTTPPHYNVGATYFLYFAIIVVMPIIGTLGTRSPQFKLPAIIWYHVTLMVMLVYFNEINGPFTALWPLLILWTSLHYGWRGFIGSSLTLPIMTVAYIALFSHDLYPNTLVYSAIAVMVNAFTILTAYLFVRIIMNARNKNRDLALAQRSEMLQANRQTALLNSISDAVMTLNRYGRVTSQNAAAQAFFDTNQSLIGQDIDKLLDLRDMTDTVVTTRSLIEQTKSSTLRDDLMIGSGGDTRHLHFYDQRDQRHRHDSGDSDMDGWGRHDTSSRFESPAG